jgi:hypothetical protein
MPEGGSTAVHHALSGMCAAGALPQVGVAIAGVGVSNGVRRPMTLGNDGVVGTFAALVAIHEWIQMHAIENPVTRELVRSYRDG